MTYPYTVKVNGKWYPANTEIPENKAKKPEKETDDKAKK